LQPARNQSFTWELKTRHLYDTTDFSGGAVFGYFHRNLMRIKVFGAKSALF